MVLSGAMIPATPAGAPAFWVGPGDVCGEVGFALGGKRGTTMAAFGPDPRFWRLHRDALSHLALPRGVVATRLLGAIARTIAARLETPRSGAATWTEADYCDHHHPAVTAMATKLARRTPEETAWAIWAVIGKMPYRFGSWQWTASETIARGHGMCISKAVLQVSLMRALGIECGYVDAELDGGRVRACLPRVYAPRFQRPTFEHCYAAARLDGRWRPLDASFSAGTLSLIAETVPHVKPFLSWDVAGEGFARGAPTLSTRDARAVEVRPDLGDVMRKTAACDAKNADAMNLLLDRAQGYVAPMKPYVARMHQALAAGSVLEARRVVMDGLADDIADLRSRAAAPRAG